MNIFVSFEYLWVKATLGRRLKNLRFELRITSSETTDEWDYRRMRLNKSVKQNFVFHRLNAIPCKNRVLLNRFQLKSMVQTYKGKIFWLFRRCSASILQWKFLKMVAFKSLWRCWTRSPWERCGCGPVSTIRSISRSPIPVICRMIEIWVHWSKVGKQFSGTFYITI